MVIARASIPGNMVLVCSRTDGYGSVVTVPIRAAGRSCWSCECQGSLGFLFVNTADCTHWHFEFARTKLLYVSPLATNLFPLNRWTSQRGCVRFVAFAPVLLLVRRLCLCSQMTRICVCSHSCSLSSRFTLAPSVLTGGFSEPALLCPAPGAWACPMPGLAPTSQHRSRRLSGVHTHMPAMSLWIPLFLGGTCFSPYWNADLW